MVLHIRTILPMTHRITAVQAVSIWNIGIKTAAAQNIVATNFINQNLGI
jgi:hypothetical protein